MSGGVPTCGQQFSRALGLPFLTNRSITFCMFNGKHVDFKRSTGRFQKVYQRNLHGRRRKKSALLQDHLPSGTGHGRVAGGCLGCVPRLGEVEAQPFPPLILVEVAHGRALTSANKAPSSGRWRRGSHKEYHFPLAKRA